MAVAYMDAADLCDVDAGSLSQPVSEVFDVRVAHASTEESGFWQGDVSLRDMLGANLLTYEDHIVAPEGEEGIPLQPKVVYVQCQGVDPVTRETAAVVIPAQLSLDVYADPRSFWSPREEEEEEEEEPEDKEEEDRRKLKSSIKGDPILLRAKPAPPPDAHFAPLRHETMLCTNALSDDTGSSLSPSGRRRKGVAEASGTMSSFLKASGKDKYSRSRLSEIDQILDQTVPKQETQDLLDRMPNMTSLHNVDPMHSEPRQLAVHMAMHIKNMPKFQKVTRRPLDEHSTDTSERTKGGLSPDQAQLSRRSSNLNWDEAAAEGLQQALTPRRASQASASLSAAATGEALGNLQRARRDAQLPDLKATPRAKLRDLDPHVNLAGIAPTQRLHSNWPDGLRRQVARHFYDMSPGQILEEEEKERLRDYRSRANAKENGAGDSAEASANDLGATAGSTASTKNRSPPLVPLKKGSPERLAYERQLKRSTAGIGMVAHGLEIRIKNSDRPGRVVVGRHTERARGKEEAPARSCMMLDKLQADRKKLSVKF